LCPLCWSRGTRLLSFVFIEKGPPPSLAGMIPPLGFVFSCEFDSGQRIRSGSHPGAWTREFAFGPDFLTLPCSAFPQKNFFLGFPPLSTLVTVCPSPFHLLHFFLNSQFLFYAHVSGFFLVSLFLFLITLRCDVNSFEVTVRSPSPSFFQAPILPVGSPGAPSSFFVNPHISLFTVNKIKYFANFLPRHKYTLGCPEPSLSFTQQLAEVHRHNYQTSPFLPRRLT